MQGTALVPDPLCPYKELAKTRMETPIKMASRKDCPVVLVTSPFIVLPPRANRDTPIPLIPTSSSAGRSTDLCHAALPPKHRGHSSCSEPQSSHLARYRRTACFGSFGLANRPTVRRSATPD